MNLYVWGITLFAAFGGFLFGYDIGVINGVKDMSSFRETFHFNGTNTSCSEDVKESTLLGLIVSLFSLGCLTGALTAGVISDRLGRKPTMMVGGVVFVVGGAIQSAAFYLWMVLLGRVVAGIGVGILSMVVPVYNAEMAPKHLRGRLVSLNQLTITAGIMVSFLVDLGCEKFDIGWRVALGLQCVLGTVLVFGMCFLPETPRWLVKKHRDIRATSVLTRIRMTSEEDIQEELREIQQAVDRNPRTEGLWEMWRPLFTWRIFQRVLIGMILQLFQQLTGMNVIMYYSTSIFCKIGVASYASTAIVGALNFFTTLLSIFLVDKVGRKALMLLGALGMLVSMVIAASLLLDFRVEEEGEGNEVVGYVVVVLICFFVFNFAYSWGPVAWVVTSEIYPLHLRGIAVSLTTAANWFGNFIIAMVTPILLASDLKTHGTFYILSGFLLAAFLFVLFTLPETKGESLERVEMLFSKPWLERINIFYYLRCGCPWWGHSRGLYLGDSNLSSSTHSDKTDDTTFLLHGESQSASETEIMYTGSTSHST